MRPPAWVLGPLRAPGVLRVVDRLVFGSRPDPSSGRHVLLAPPGGGNIGDQALVEAFVEAVDGEVCVIVRAHGDIAIPPALAGRMSTLPLPALVYGSAVGRARDLRRLAKAVSGSASFSVIGADVMDGAYVPRASVGRSLLARRFAELRWDTRVVGFSWNSAPAQSALAALRAANTAGARLHLRDPRSAARAREDGLIVMDGADIVFTARTRDDGIVAALMPGLDPRERLALVNASGLVGAGVEAYAETIRVLRDGGLRVLVVPHVSRAGADDLPLCTALADLFAADEGVRLVPRLLAPSQIRALGARASVVVTGRMHLAVMSLAAGTPALTVATQGKVEGLMDLFGAPGLCIAPGEDFARALPAATERLVADEEALRRVIDDRRDGVVDLAWRNVEGLTRAGADRRREEAA